MEQPPGLWRASSMGSASIACRRWCANATKERFNCWILALARMRAYTRCETPAPRHCLRPGVSEICAGSPIVHERREPCLL